MPDWNEIRNEWETTKITFKALAEKHGVKEGTLKSRRSREGWSRDATKKDATIQKDATIKNGKDATGSSGDSKGDKNKSTSNGKRKKQSNRSGNPNPKNQFTKRNQAARKHGLFANFIQPEQQEIIDSMQDLTIADQIWMQIEIKFSAIIRMQKIMWVAFEDDHLKEESGYSSGAEGDSVSYKVVYAHERYESYIRTQARAMAEYRNLVKQYIELTDEFDERRLKLEGMQMNIDKSKAELDYLKGDTTDDAHERMQQYMQAIGKSDVKAVFDDE